MRQLPNHVQFRLRVPRKRSGAALTLLAHLFPNPHPHSSSPSTIPTIFRKNIQIDVLKVYKAQSTCLSPWTSWKRVLLCLEFDNRSLSWLLTYQNPRLQTHTITTHHHNTGHDLYRKPSIPLLLRRIIQDSRLPSYSYDVHVPALPFGPVRPSWVADADTFPHALSQPGSRSSFYTLRNSKLPDG